MRLIYFNFWCLIDYIFLCFVEKCFVSALWVRLILYLCKQKKIKEIQSKNNG